MMTIFVRVSQATKTGRSQHSQKCKDPRRQFLCIVTLTFDLLTPKQIIFQDSSWNISI